MENYNISPATDTTIIDKTTHFSIDADKKSLEKYEMVNSPRHYNSYDVEVIDMIERIWGPEQTMIWCKITAFKYRMRMGTKPGEGASRDLDKEQWYLRKAEELKNKIL